MTTPATTATTTKICVACGQDCSTKPRTRDKQGRYTCKACYDRLMAGHAGGAQPLTVKPAAPAAAVKVLRPKPAPQPEPAGEDDLLGSLLESTGGAACVACGSQLAPGAAICTICGTNQETGQQLSTALVKEKEVKEKKLRRRRTFYVDPMLAALVMLAAFGGMFVMAMDSGAWFALYVGLGGILGLTAFITAVVTAFKDDEKGWGIVLICNFVPVINMFTGLLSLYYIFCVCERGMVKAMYVVSFLVWIGMFFLAAQHSAAF